MDLSIIIVNWNAKEMLQNCLSSIYRTKGNLKLQIIVVDNSSSDGSAELIRTSFLEVKLIESGGNFGFARANNLAISHAVAPLILFLNPDTLVKENSLEKMVHFLKNNPSVGALGCKITDAYGRVQDIGTQWFPSPAKKLFEMLLVSEKSIQIVKRLIPYKDPNISSEVVSLFGACLMVRKSVLDEVGLFDERFFMYCEDVDLCCRLGAHRWKIYYMSEAEIVHLIGGATKKSDSDFSVLMMCESISLFIEKYHGYRGKALYVLVVLFGALYRLSMIYVLRSISIFYNAGSKVPPKVSLKRSLRKYITMIKWGLNFKKATVPK